MRIQNLLLAACCLGAAALTVQSQADDGREQPVTQSAASAPSPAAASGPVPVRHVVDTGQSSGGPDEPQYSIDASWQIAGYNDEEVIYSIVITNKDPNIIRCTTLLSGFYLENGARHSVSDRQSVTLFPGKKSSAGTWVGMDQTAGATYKVTCRAVS